VRWSAKWVVLVTVLVGLAACQSEQKELSQQQADSIKWETDPRFAGNRAMVKLLDSIAVVADPFKNYYLSGKRAQLMLANTPKFNNSTNIIRWEQRYCFELLNAGQVDDCIKTLTKMMENYPGGREAALLDSEFKPVFDLLALAYLRKGENDNCLANHNNSSCIVPLKSTAWHSNKTGSENAVLVFNEILGQYPDDIQSRYLLNIAHMTLGQYPQGVPEAYRMDLAAQEKKEKAMQPFQNTAMDLGMDVDGLSGGAIVEDFNNDGYLDVFCSGYGLYDNVRLVLSDGKGGFSDATQSGMLQGIRGGLNAKQADYDNDGFVDILLLRGAWLDEGGEWPNSLLHNNGDGTFSDVTMAARMVAYRPTETATWGDINGDGLLDVFIANENNEKYQFPCELFINNGDGTFTESIKAYGLDQQFGWAKAALFCDMNKDGKLDLYLSSLKGQNHLFMNRGMRNGKPEFEDIAAKAGLKGPEMSFPAIIMDYDQDGWDDILVATFPIPTLSRVGEEVGAEMLGKETGVEKTKLFRNLGNERFQEVSKQTGVDKMIYAMGFNFGDFDNDGYFDFYAGTGAFEFNSLVPNRAFLNQAGHFVEVTSQSGLGHLQKGHGIAFGDLDNDGDQDIYTTLGGAVEGDNARNALFLNSNSINDWITLKLTGKTIPRDAQNSRVIIHTLQKGQAKDFHFCVGSGGTFGANSLQLEAGLGQAGNTVDVEIWWGGDPAKKQVFKALDTRHFYSITEQEPKAKMLEAKAVALKSENGKASCCH